MWNPFKKLRHRYKVWKEWTNYTNYSRFSKLMVFLKIKPCPWFEEYWVKRDDMSNYGKLHYKIDELYNVEGK